MAHPVSAVAAFVGIIFPALEAINLLHEKLQTLVDAPRTLANLQDDLFLVDMATRELHEVEHATLESLGQGVEKYLEHIIIICRTACDAFQDDLTRWMEHSADGRLSFLDQVDVAFFSKQKIKSLSKKLGNCRSAINMATNIAARHISIRQANTTESIQTVVAQGREVITAAIATVDTQVVEVEQRLRDVSMVPAKEPNEAKEKEEVIQQIDMERRPLNEFKGLLTELHSRLVITNVSVRDNGSNLIVGRINSESNVNMRIDRVAARLGGQAIVGDVKGLPLERFFR